MAVGVTRTQRQRLKQLSARFHTAAKRLAKVGEQLAHEYTQAILAKKRQLSELTLLHAIDENAVVGIATAARVGDKTMVEMAARASRNIQLVLRHTTIRPGQVSTLVSIVRLDGARRTVTAAHLCGLATEGITKNIKPLTETLKGFQKVGFITINDVGRCKPTQTGLEFVTDGLRQHFARFSAAYHSLTQTERELFGSLMKQLTRPQCKLVSRIPGDVDAFADMCRTYWSRHPGFGTTTLNPTQAGALALLWRHASQPGPLGAAPTGPAGMRLNAFLEATGLTHVTVRQLVGDNLLHTAAIDDAVYVTLGTAGHAVAEQLVIKPEECDVAPFVKAFAALGQDRADQLTQLLDKVVIRMAEP